MANPNPDISGLIPFTKGDKRINRRGKPKDFIALRKLAVKIAGETIPNPNGEDYTRIEAMLRVLTSSKNPADRALFLAYAYGKPKDELDVTSAGESLVPKQLSDADKMTRLMALARKAINGNS